MPSPSVGSLRLLVVDDDLAFAEALGEWMRLSGHDVTVVNDPATGLARVRDEVYDVVLLDMVMPSMDGLTFIQQLPGQHRPEVIVVSGAVTVRSAVDAIKLGAHDCVPKTGDFEALEILVRKAGEMHRLSREYRLMSRRVEHATSAPEIITRSPRMQEILDVLGKVAVSNVSVLLTGESGTGKDLLARTLHGLSGRASGPFIDVNCAALSESLLEAELFGHEKGSFTGATSTRPGLVEAADGGTLFLDEVVEMPPPLQAKLLRMTEDRSLYRVGGRQKIRVDIRIVSASNRDLQKAIAQGRLREDLYYRLAGVEILVPPLRERPEDVEPLASHYLKTAARQAGRGPSSLTPAALAALRGYRWLGNVRELRNMMERLALLVQGDVVDIRHLPLDVPRGEPAVRPSVVPGGLPLREMERQAIERVLHEEGWHHGRAAARLGLPIRTLYRKIKTYSLSRPHREGPRAAGSGRPA